MSVTSERSCTSPESAADSSSICMKLKRRWIEMTIDEEADQMTYPVDLTVKKPKIVAARKFHADDVSSMKPSVILPDDPRNWNKRDVQIWLKFINTTYNIHVSPDKFDMNGKALCMMSMDMFTERVPNGGKFLYKDFILRLHRAVFFQEQPKPDYSKMSPLQLLTHTAGKYFPQ